MAVHICLQYERARPVNIRVEFIALLPRAHGATATLGIDTRTASHDNGIPRQKMLGSRQPNVPRQRVVGPGHVYGQVRPGRADVRDPSTGICEVSLCSFHVLRRVAESRVGEPQQQQQQQRSCGVYVVV